ncbi:MAG: J domain-containing protein [Lachnospiraceae bacterium]|nr:J domain-containing protein [Lachnospiraceae bacterium]
MEKALKILKINCLSLIAIPLLLIATFFKLLAKAFEKISIFLLLGFAALIIIVLLVSGLVPANLVQLFVGLVVILLLFGAVIAACMWAVAIISGVTALIWSTIISLMDSLYEYAYNGYLHLYAKCEADYKLLSLNGRKVPNAIACLFFTILKSMSWVITKLVTLSYVFGFALSGIVLIATLYDLNKNTKIAFGMNLIQYTKKCELHSAIFGILIYFVLIGIIITSILALATEWYEWGQELQMTNAQISKEVTDLVASDLKMASGTSEEVEKNIEHLKKLEEHVNSLDDLSQRVMAVLEAKDSPLLRSYWGIYMRNLEPLVSECSEKKGIDIHRFKQLIPQIQLLDKQRSEVEKLAAKLERELQNPSGKSVFFAGCDTLDKLEKRYKALCKTYHPDIAEGDTETFQKMQGEYQSLKAALAQTTKSAKNKA